MSPLAKRPCCLFRPPTLRAPTHARQSRVAGYSRITQAFGEAWSHGYRAAVRRDNGVPDLGLDELTVRHSDARSRRRRFGPARALRDLRASRLPDSSTRLVPRRLIVVRRTCRDARG